MGFAYFCFSGYLNEFYFTHFTRVFLFIELQEVLQTFFNEQIQVTANETAQLAIEPLVQGELEIQTLLDQWLKLVQVNSDSTRMTTKKEDPMSFCFLILGM